MRELIIKFLISIFKIFPVNRRKIIFQSYYGTNYGCNPKYLSEHIQKNHSDKFRIIWSFIDPKNHQNLTGVSIVKHNSLKYYFHLSTAGSIIHNYRMPEDFKKRPSQLYIQTWHSSLRIKMIEGDAASHLKQAYKEMALNDSKQIDILISGCRFSTDIFKRAFWYSGQILECGTPRNDIFFRDSFVCINRVRKYLNVDSNAKLLLYAPTFRESQSLDAYNVDFFNVLNALNKRFGGEWKVVLRLHPHLCNLSSALKERYGYMVLDATGYDDIQDLLCTADALISDYSSLIFDYMFTNRPIWLYASDYREYIEKERGLYFKIDELPCSLTKTNEELVSEIINFDSLQFQKSVGEFQDKIGNYESGNASKVIAETIISRHSL